MLVIDRQLLNLIFNEANASLALLFQFNCGFVTKSACIGFTYRPVCF